ncbi:MAG: alpha/beta hydrolase [Oscillospiraceae bacterium]|nr:alpha/beta hydrolase [Oscillospiraceae bacterium]
MLLHSYGVDIYIEKRGGEGSAVLLLHGWGCDASMWRVIADRLSAEAAVYALDFPGHGRSGKLTVPWDAKDYAAMVADVIGQLGIAGCVVVGHSHGGRVALRLALDYPELVGKLVVTGGSGLRGKKAGKRTFKQSVYKVMKNTLTALDKARVFGNLPKRGISALRCKFGSPDYRKLTTDIERATFIKLVSADMTDEIANIKKPTLLIWGDKDTETPLWMAEKMKELIPDSGLVVFEGGDHFAHIYQPERFAAIVSAFL